MKRSELRKVFIGALNNIGNPTTLETFIHRIASLSYEKSLIKDKEIKDEYDRDNIKKMSTFYRQFIKKYETGISSLFWEFVFNGTLAVRIQESGNRFLLNDFYITEYGKTWLKSEGEIIPEGKKDYIGFLKSIPMDSIALDYTIESLATFKSKHYFASAVMLGAASERILYLLAGEMKKSQKIDTNEKKFIESFNKGETKQLLDKIYEILKKNIKNVIPVEVHREALDHINCLIDVARLQRNDAVHSRLKEMDREQLRLILLALPHACKRIYAFINWFKSKG